MKAGRLVKRAVARVPGGPELVQWLLYLRFRWRTRSRTAKDTFTHYYHRNYWRNSESRSGAGSTLNYTERIRRELPRLFARLELHSMLDAPCGDFHWFRLVERPQGLLYVGGDIVAALVADNQSRYGNETTRFVELDITQDRLPEVDLWMCRDALFHLPTKDVLRTIDNLLASRIQWFLTSTHPDCKRNRDIPVGHFRLLNLELPPFDFPRPEACIDDWIPGYPKRHLALWRTASLRAALRKA